MAKERYIDTSFWDDKYIKTLQSDGKLLYIYCFTGPLTNIAGIYEVTLDHINFHTGLSLIRIDELLKKFEQDQKIYYFDGWIIVCNMPKHQKWEQKPKINEGIKAVLRKLPPKILNHINTLSIPYTYPLNYLDLDLDPNTDLDLKDGNPKRLIDYYHDKFLDKFGVKPIINGPKDASLFKKALQSHSEEKLKFLLDAFFESKDQFIVNSGYTVGVFYSQINKLIVSAGAKEPIKVDHSKERAERIIRGED